MGASIREVLAESLLGSSTPLDWDEVSRHLQTVVNDQKQIDRVADHRERQEFYQDGGHTQMAELIDKTIKDAGNKDLRKEWIDAAGFNNVTRRIITTHSTVYQDPALRSVGGKTNNALYQKAQQSFQQHDRSRQWNKLGNLHRTLLAQVRVRNIGSQSIPVLQPRIDIITPAQIPALISSPKDPTRLEGAIIQLSGYTARAGKEQPHSILWTNREVGYLRKNGSLMAEPVEHGLERMPLVLLKMDDDTDSLWSSFGKALIAAHKAEWFCEICLLKETKSATKQAILAGDLTAAAREQASDSETAITLPDGVSHQMADMSMDLSMFRDTSGHIVDTAASSYGIAPAILRHEGVQSAEARDMMRIPLRELRIEQHSPLREFERELAMVQSMVLKKDMPELAFEIDGWSIDFADPQTPRSGKEQLEEFEHSRRLRLTSTIKNVMRRNPDLDRKQAEAEIEENIADELWFNILQRPFMELSGAMHGAPADSGTVTPTATGDATSDDNSNGRADAVTPTQKGEGATVNG